MHFYKLIWYLFSLQSIFDDSSLHSSCWGDDVSIDGVVEVGPEWPDDWVNTNLPQIKGAIAKGAALFMLKAYFSNLIL